MSNYFAEIDANGLVIRVIVAPSQEWCEERLGGTWLETADPYSAEPQAVTYCGPGYGADPAFPERFAPPWQMPAPDAEGVWSSYAKGDLRYHGGKLWRSTCDGNVWEPGVSAWHPESEIEGILPDWIQPTGAHDSYPLGFQVRHGGQDWYVHAVDANGHNVWAPGTFGWTPIGQEPPAGATWVDTGATVSGQAGQLYYLSATVAALGLSAGQAIKLGEAETTFAALWPGTDNLIQVSPYVTASVGAKVWKWA
jgi:hypothetical protein